jgi:hypothetical protein
MAAAAAVASIFKRGQKADHASAAGGADGEDAAATAAAAAGLDTQQQLDEHLSQLAAAWAAPKSKCGVGRGACAATCCCEANTLCHKHDWPAAWAHSRACVNAHTPRTQVEPRAGGLAAGRGRV